MIKFKKVLCTALALVCFASAAPQTLAYTDIAAGEPCLEAVTRLGDLGIISGYSDGSFHPGDTITRAEFARIIVSALDKDTEAKSAGFVSSFADVPAGLWSAPYINYVSAQNIVAGYSDGSFCPDKTISFAESLTILMRILGYTEDTVGYFWPNNYVDAANSLGISSDMAYGVNQPITRGDAAIMLDRVLFTDMSGKTDEPLISTSSSRSVMKDIIVLESGAQSSKLLPREVKLSDSKVYTSKMSTSASAGEFADYAVLDKSGNLVALKVTGAGANKAANSMAVYVNSVTDNTVNYISNGQSGSYRFDGSFEVYTSDGKTTFAQAKSLIKAGTDLTFYGEVSGSWSFAVVGTDNDITPVIARHDYTTSDTNMEGTTINSAGLVVYRDAKAATLADIKTNDVVYYNTRTNVMDVYSKKVTGIYYDAQPSKAYVESVTVGGKNYELSGDAAANALGAGTGSFEIGDRVTLLLGKNDKAVFAVELSDTAIGSYGVVLSVGSRIAESGNNEGSSERYADVFMTDGETHRIVTDGKYESAIGQLVKITYQDGAAHLATQSRPDGRSGKLDRVNRTLNGRSILKDAVIIQRTYYKEETEARCELLQLETMAATEISDAQLLNIVSGSSFGDISVIYVKDVESTSDFGVVSKVVKGKDDSVLGYEIFRDSEKTSYNTSMVAAGLSVGTPVMYELEGGQIDTIKQLYKVGSGTVGAVDSSRIMLGNTVYDLAPDVQYVRILGTDYSTLSQDEMESGKYKTAAVYSDTSKSSGCRIRIIIVN